MKYTLAKTLDECEHLYPDIIKTGNLSEALQRELNGIGSSLKVSSMDEDFIVYANVNKDTQISQVYIAASERLFLIDFWSKGIQLAKGSTEDFRIAVEAIEHWCSSNNPLENLSKKFKFIEINPIADSFQEGTIVKDRWENMKNNALKYYPKLADFIFEAYHTEILNKLFPFTSMDKLCFSRCTGYPYHTDGIPSVWPDSEGGYIIYLSDEELGSGNAKDALNVLLKNLPDNCGPAIEGTAEDFKDG